MAAATLGLACPHSLLVRGGSSISAGGRSPRLGIQIDLPSPRAARRAWGSRGKRHGRRALLTVVAGKATIKGEGSDAEEGAWCDSWGNLVRAPIGFKALMIKDPAKEDEDQKDWSVHRVDVGAVGERKELPYAFQKILAPPSQVYSISRERPLGMVLEMDLAGLVRVVELVRGGEASQGDAIARLGSAPEGGSVAVGDVLRAVTSTTMTFGSGSKLLGELTGTERRVVLYGCDGQAWASTQKALSTGLVADGAVGLVLERPGKDSPDAAYVIPSADEYFGEGMSEEAELASVPGTLDEAESFNVAIFAVSATFIGLILAGFS